MGYEAFKRIGNATDYDLAQGTGALTSKTKKMPGLRRKRSVKAADEKSPADKGKRTAGVRPAPARLRDIVPSSRSSPDEPEDDYEDKVEQSASSASGEELDFLSMLDSKGGGVMEDEESDESIEKHPDRTGLPKAQPVPDLPFDDKAPHKPDRAFQRGLVKRLMVDLNDPGECIYQCSICQLVRPVK